MSKIKDLNCVLYESHFEAIKTFIKEGQLDRYAFPVSSRASTLNALAYLCVNDIPHSYHVVNAHGVVLVTLSWTDGSYSFWCEEEP